MQNYYKFTFLFNLIWNYFFIFINHFTQFAQNTIFSRLYATFYTIYSIVLCAFITVYLFFQYFYFFV